MQDFEQDQETVIQQLRLLLAAKEEELARLRSGGGGAGEGTQESVTDQLLKELEEKKREASELRAQIKEVQTRAREKLSAMADELESKEQLIASLRADSSAGSKTAPAAGDKSIINDLQAELAAAREEAARRIAELEQRIKERDLLLEKAAGNQSPKENGEEAILEIRRLRDELERARAEHADIEALIAEKDAARAQAESLRAEAEQTRVAYEERLAELQGQLESLQEASPTREAGSGENGDRALAIERALDQMEASYRTAQVRIRTLMRAQQVFKGLCAGLAVALLCILGMKVKQHQPPPLEAAPLSNPLPLTRDEVELLPAPDLTASMPKAIEQETVLACPAPSHPESDSRAVDAAVRIAYTVKKGDSLWLICQRVLGDGSAAAAVARDNKISDPGNLKAGDVIYLSKK